MKSRKLFLLVGAFALLDWFIAWVGHSGYEFRSQPKKVMPVIKK